MTNLIRLIKLLWDYPAQTVGGLLAIVVSNCAQLSIPWITGRVIDLLEAKSLNGTQLVYWGLLILFLALVSYLSKQVWRHLILGSARRVEAKLRQELLQKTLSLSLKTSRGIDNGKFMALATSDIPAVGQALAFGVIAFFDSLFITACAFILMFRLSPTLTAYSMVPFPILVVIMLLSLRLIYQRYDETQSRLEEVTEKTRESISGIRTLRAYAQAKGDEVVFEERNQAYLKQMLEYVKVDALFSPLILLFAGSSSAILLYFGGNLVILGRISIGTMAAFVGYLSLLTWPMIAVGWMLVILQRGSASIARIDRLHRESSEIETGPPLPPATGLTIRNLSFGYDGETPVLDNINLDLEPSCTIGIVGPVGSGKSSLLKLLQRLEEPPTGCIFLGDNDITQFSGASVRAHFAYVGQEPFLFSDTIETNLLIGSPTASPGELSEVVRLASLTEDLELFPDNYSTLLGERGVSLSGGQKQRTALARALLRNAPVLLLDDTLSAVDTVTERQILEHLRLRQAERGQSTLIVSHRLSAVEHADEILVLVGGKIVDRGSHSELRERPGLYQTLLQHQSSNDKEYLLD